ncbi:MAG: NUDIX domain-containing protein [Anaerolineales bacterium]|nr:NUDIX domain-containing protein [Anaerolineales bacterium]
MSLDIKDHPEESIWVKIIDCTEDYSYRSMFRVIRATLQYRRFDGHMSEEITRINFERGDSVGVLLYDPEEDVVVLTRQFRYPVYASIDPEIVKESGARQAWLLEIAAGIIDPGHNAVEIASKEILEEAGYVVPGDLHPITTIYPSPGGTSERIHLFLGLVDHTDRIYIEEGLPVKEEDIQVKFLSFQESMTMIARGEISDAKTIIAIQHLALLKSRGDEF